MRKCQPIMISRGQLAWLTIERILGILKLVRVYKYTNNMPGEISLGAQVEMPKLTVKEQMEAATKRHEVGAEKGLDKVEGFRSKTKEFVVEKIKQFRKWDRDISVKLMGGIASLPEKGAILAKAGIEKVGNGVTASEKAVFDAAVAGKEAFMGTVESGEKFLIDRKDAVIEKGRETGRWVEARGNDIENFAESTKDKVVDRVDRGVEKVMDKYEDIKSGIKNSYEKTTGFMSDKAKELKLRVIKAALQIGSGVGQESAMGAHSSVEKNRIRLEKSIARETAHNNRVGALEHQLALINRELNIKDN